MRDAELYISSSMLRRLRAAADILELSTADQLAEQWIGERLSQMPEVDELISEQRKASAKVREQWQKRRLTEAVGPIPTT